MVKRFCVFMGDPAQLSLQSTALVYLNQALEELQNLTVRASDVGEVSSTELSVTAASTSVDEHTLPAACRKIVRVERKVTGGENIRLNPTPFQSHIDDPTENQVQWEGDTSECATWYHKGATIGFVRPSESFTAIVYYEGQWAEMTEGETECPAPIGFHSLVVAKATVAALELEGKPVPSSISQTVKEQQAMFMTHISRRQTMAPEYVE